LGVAQLTGRISLHDVVSNLKEQAGKLYLPQPKTLTTNLYARHRPAKEKVCSEAD
jgi:hypothetical protein